MPSIDRQSLILNRKPIDYFFYALEWSGRIVVIPEDDPNEECLKKKQLHSAMR